MAAPCPGGALVTPVKFGLSFLGISSRFFGIIGAKTPWRSVWERMLWCSVWPPGTELASAGRRKVFVTRGPGPRRRLAACGMLLVLLTAAFAVSRAQAFLRLAWHATVCHQ